MALVDLTDSDVVDFIKFLISKGANVNNADLKGDTPLHLMAIYTSKLNHREAQIKENKDREEANLIAVIKVLLEHGANLAAKNNDGQTPFSLALKGSRVKILDLLSDSVKISENTQLLHDFKDYIFDDRYLTIFYKLLKREEQTLTANDFNLLDARGFSVFLTYIKSWTKNYNSIYSKVTTECQNQYRIHKKDWQKYSFTQEEINDSYRAEWMKNHYPQSDPGAFTYSPHQDNSFSTAFDAKMQKKIIRKFVIELYE